MEVKILKGTNQIGGCITEITSKKGTKIIIDFGEDLDDSIKTNIDIDGLTSGNKKYDAVFITHSHTDHIGLINNILDDIPVYVEKYSKKIYVLSSVFTHKKARLKTTHMYFKTPINIKDDIIVTPYLVDHSSYNSSMLLIEVDGKKILHTGDYRSNGLKGNDFELTLKEIGHVDMIITEGTSLSKNDEENETEEALMKRVEEAFKKYNQVFILQSSTNIDRIVGFYNTAIKTNKNFIQDLFTANITSSLKDKNVPKPGFPNLYVWIPTKYNKKSLKFYKKYIMPFKKYSKMISYKDNNYALMVKNTMLDDLKKLYNKNHITNACLIYSMWNGYKEKEDINNFLDKIKELGIKEVIDYHTSGHADKKTIELLNSLNAKKVIPIHTTNPEKLTKILNNVVLVKDDEVIKL